MPCWGGFGALRDGKKERENELSEMLSVAKQDQKTMKNQALRALGGLLGALGRQSGPLRLKKVSMRSRPAT